MNRAEKISEKLLVNFKKFHDRPDDYQMIMFAQNLLAFAKAYSQEKDPLFQVVSECLYQTANMVYQTQTKKEKKRS